MIWDINLTLRKFIKSRFTWSLEVSNNWTQMVDLLTNYRPVFSSRIVQWSPPPNGWLKCNTDGASRGNPGPSFAAFCLRDSNGNLVVATGVKLLDSTNLVAEAVAIREGLNYCLNNQLTQIILEANSMVMVNILNGRCGRFLGV